MPLVQINVQFSVVSSSKELLLLQSIDWKMNNASIDSFFEMPIFFNLKLKHRAYTIIWFHKFLLFKVIFVINKIIFVYFSFYLKRKKNFSGESAMKFYYFSRVMWIESNISRWYFPCCAVFFCIFTRFRFRVRTARHLNLNVGRYHG